MGEYDELRIVKDELTGLLDKQSFYDCAHVLLEEADPEKEYAFVFFDLANFKAFNANYGYEKGDELLTIIGKVIQDVFKGQLISRFSGDHFVVCAYSTQVIPNIRSIRDRIKLVQRNINIELKAGIYICENEDKDVIRCCDRARVACISIKKMYDLEYKIYDEELGGTLRKKQQILDNLDEALEKKYIQVYYQPIVRAYTGKVCAWEALVRWIDPVKGMIYPNEFIPVLEEYRLIPKIDAFVMEEVFSKYQQQMRNKRESVPVSINLSRIDFEVVDLASFIDELMEKYDCPKDMFHFEVTESALMENPQFILEQISKLREKGYQIWMDDFGSGYSSLNLLKDHQFDLVKIDMDFLRDFDTTEKGKIILRHIVSMIKNLNIHTLVEGVETLEQFEFMRSIGCEMIQGYLIGRPMPFIEGLECILKDGRTLERQPERRFYENLGRIDVLRQNPLQNISNQVIENPLPLAIIVAKNGKWKYVYTNSSYKEIICDFGFKSPEQMEEQLNEEGNRAWVQYSHFIEICTHSKEMGKSESMDFIQDGHIVNMRVRHVISDPDSGKDAYLISIRMLSRLLNSNYDNKVAEISNNMFSFYECVDLFGIEEEYFENIYLHDSRLHINLKNKRPNEVLEGIKNKLVHVEDRERFGSFFNLKTIKERIENEPTKMIQGFFRILDVKGEYAWKSVNLSLMHFENFDAVMSCVCEACTDLSERIQNSEGTYCYEYQDDIEKNDTDKSVDNILHLLPIGVFWKDKERRFLGANQMFLDYYGMESEESIIGKTDEDMGWHVDPEPFMKDELAVINEGKIIKNVEGECIIKGQVRQILATKKPYIVDGKIEGLVGFFKDVTDEVAERERLEKLSITDELTGLYNRSGFNKIVKKYISQYEKDRTDFAILMLDIDKFKTINDLSGHDFGDLVLQRTSQVLRQVAAESSVVCRFGGDEFVILHQIKSIAEIDSIKQEIRLGLRKITHIEDMQTKIRVSIGAAIYSECGNISDCIDKADQQMYADKELRRNS